MKNQREKPYPKSYDECIIEAKEEINNNERPELVNTLESIDDYDVIYLGCPVYWGYMPQPLAIQLEKLNWDGKIIKPFITHEGSGEASIPSQIKSICNNVKVLDAITIYGSSVKDAKNKIENWIKIL